MLLTTHLSSTFLSSGVSLPLHFVKFLLFLLSWSASSTWGMSITTSQMNSTISVIGASHQMFLNAVHSSQEAAKWMKIQTPMKRRKLRIVMMIQKFLNPLVSQAWRLYITKFQSLPKAKLTNKQKIADLHLVLTHWTPLSQQTMIKSIAESPV